MSTNAADLAARVRALVVADKLGNGAVSASTVAELVAMLVPPPDDDGSLAERADVLALLRAIDAGDGRMVRRRLSAAIHTISAGLHRGSVRKEIK